MKVDIQAFSKTESLRLYIIEHTIHIEALISEVIGTLLGIDYKTSKSFGFKSSSLSFNQKVYLIQDINGLDSEMAKKLTYLMNIRNKFAHVQSIYKFEDFFEVAGNGTEIKNKLEKWYSLDDKKEDDDKYKFMFFNLSKDITEMLWTLQVETRQRNKVSELTASINKKYLETYKEEVSKFENGDKLNNEILEKTLKKMPNIKVAKKKK